MAFVLKHGSTTQTSWPNSPPTTELLEDRDHPPLDTTDAQNLRIYTALVKRQQESHDVEKLI
eukprot:3108117-Amphidinium_carterae.1